MNVYDYLLGQSGFLYKSFLLGNKEEALLPGTLSSDSMKLARYLVETYGQNKNILLISPNNTYFIIAYMAIIKSGNVCVPLNPSIEPDNLSFVVDLCKAKTAFIAPQLESERWDDIDEVIYDYQELEGSVNVGASEDLPEQVGFDEDRLAEIIFTSGSTGEPKGSDDQPREHHCQYRIDY